MPSIKDAPRVNISEFLMGVADWHPYYPDGYPIRDGFHNPWLPIDPISGNTAYDIWSKDKSVSEDDFRQKLTDLTQR